MAARDALTKILGEGTVGISRIGQDKYGGRVDADVSTARTPDVSVVLLERGLARLENLLSEPKRAVEVFDALFARPITADLLGMATGEAMAHLNYLSGAGRAVRESDNAGVWRWRKSV